MYTIIDGKKYNIIIMNTFFKRLIGLMFKKDKITNIYMFPRCSSIHTYFMKQNIDVCILSKNYKINYIISSLKPGKVIIRKGYYTLEMPLGLSNKLKVGEKLVIKSDAI